MVAKESSVILEVKNLTTADGMLKNVSFIRY